MVEEIEESDQAAAPAASGVAPAAAGAVANHTRAAGETEGAAVEETEGPARGDTAAATEEGGDGGASAAARSPWPCRRRRGAASLFLSQRQRTGGLRWRGVGVGEAGKDTFRRQALSTVLANGMRIQRLRLGRTSNSRTRAGVARGHPESQGVQGRVAGGVSCMEFDSVGWQLAVGGENVTVYDFDRYLPEVCLLLWCRWWLLLYCTAVTLGIFVCASASIVGSIFGASVSCANSSRVSLGPTFINQPCRSDNVHGFTRRGHPQHVASVARVFSFFV